MERGKRIELSALAWKAKVLPLYEPRIKNFGAPEETRTPKIWLLRPTRIPIPSPGQNLHIETHYSSAEQFDCSAVCFYMVPDVGIELTTYRLQGGCSTTELIRHIYTLNCKRTIVNFLTCVYYSRIFMSCQPLLNLNLVEVTGLEPAT